MTKCDHIESVAISSWASRKHQQENIQFKRVLSYFHCSIQGEITAVVFSFLEIQKIAKIDDDQI